MPSNCDPCDTCDPSCPGYITVETNDKCSPMYVKNSRCLDVVFIDTLINYLTGIVGGEYVNPINQKEGALFLIGAINALGNIELTNGQFDFVKNTLVASLSLYGLPAPDVNMVLTSGQNKITICLKWGIVVQTPPLNPIEPGGLD